MDDQAQKSKPRTKSWPALLVGSLFIAFGVAMFGWILSWRGLLDASPYAIVVVIGVYVCVLPRRRARSQAKSGTDR